MSRLEKIEVCWILIFSGAAVFLHQKIPGTVSLGNLLLLTSGLLLLQSLIRDLFLLAAAKKLSSTKPKREARCMCVESTVGITGIIIAAIVLAAGFGGTVSLGRWAWGGLVLSVLGFGFLIKDYVFEWSPFGFRKDKDHINIVVKPELRS